MQEPEPSSRHLHAGRHLGSRQAPPRLIPGLQSIPGLDVTFVFRHVISGSLSLAFLAHTCRAQWRDFPVTLTTTALDRSSPRRFAASSCTAAAEGHQANNTRLLHLLHSTESSDPGLLHPVSFNVRGTPADDLRVSSLTTCSSLLLCGCESRVWATGALGAGPSRESVARVPLDSRDLLLEPRTASVEPPLDR
jgi:hypothetical protein